MVKTIRYSNIVFYITSDSAPSSPGDQGQNTQTLIILLNTPQKNASEPGSWMRRKYPEIQPKLSPPLSAGNDPKKQQKMGIVAVFLSCDH